jgi:hypothetical protein
VGSSGLGPWQEQEVYAFLREFINRGCPVIPTLLTDAPQQPEPDLPVLLQDKTWVDFRQPDPDPMGQLIWGITGERPIRDREKPRLDTGGQKPSYDLEYKHIIDAFSYGLDPFTFGGVIPFLGAGVNLVKLLQISPIAMVSRLAQEYNESRERKSLIGVPCSICPLPLKGWPPPKECPLHKLECPQGDAQSVSAQSCPLADEQRLVLAKMNLRLLVQYVKLMEEQQLYQKLHRLFDRDIAECQPNEVHRFLATLPRKMADKGYPLPYQLIVTTNYDDMLERAFLDARQPFDLVYYVAEGDKDVRGRFKHKTWEEVASGEGEGKILSEQDSSLPFRKHPIILKLYGTWDDKFVITEEHHINYLSSYPITEALTSKLLNALTNENNQLLLLGYSLNDGDLELILRRCSEAQQTLEGKFWIVHQSTPGSLEEQIWGQRKVKGLIKSSLEECIANLAERIERLDYQRRVNP